MKKIILKSITLSEWKGQNRTVDFGEKQNYIKGRNASGKTTLLKAFCWLLTGYSDANTPKNADLYDNTKELSKDTPKASVKALISIDEKVYELRRTAVAKFIRRRGTDTYEKASSDEYEFFVDGIKYTAMEFDDWVCTNIADVNLLKYTLSGDFFINQVFDDKKKARNIIEQIVGSVSDSDMTGDYPIINELKGKYTIQQIDEQAANRIKSINEGLDSIPSAIRLNEDDISKLKEVNVDAVENEIASLEDESRTIDCQMFDISERVKPLLEAKHVAETARNMKQEVYDKAKQTYEKSWGERDNALVKEISETKYQNQCNNEKKRDLSSQIETRHDMITNLERHIIELREKVKEVKTQASYKCPLCGTVLTGEDSDSRRDVYNRLVEEGKEAANNIEKIKSELTGLQKQLDDIPSDIDVLELEKKLSELRSIDILPFAQTEQGIALKADVDAIEIPEVIIPDNRQLQDRKDAVTEKLKLLYEKRGVTKMIESRGQKILELREQQKSLAEQLGHYELQRLEVKKYKQEQMRILSERVNNSLVHSSIDIWSTQKDGSIVPDLVLKNADGVNYSTANNASRIVTSIDIQRLFCEKLGVDMPVWCDEASVLNRDNLPKFDGTQTFYMLCSEEPFNIYYN